VNPDHRYELKFVIDNSGLSHAMQWLYNYTHAGERYPRRKVNSLYFDDLDLSSARDNLAGLSNRQKMRLRWYGCDDNSSPVFEVKVRNDRLVCKKNYPMSSLRHSLLKINIKDITSECKEEMRKQEVIFDEHFISTLQVCYDRSYYEDLNGIRITIDQNIKYYCSLPHQKLNESISIPCQYNVLEVKFDRNLKTTVEKLIKPLHIAPKRHSKYLVGLSMFGYVVYV
jgi:hypothetical protein